MADGVINLTSRVYYDNLECSMKSANKIDTISFDLMANDVGGTDASTELNESFTTCQLNGKLVTLPIKQATPSHYRCMLNRYYALGPGTQEYAKARVDCVMASGQRTIILEKPFTSVSSVKLSFLGKSYVIGNKKLKYTDYPSIENLKDPAYDLCAWIESTGAAEEQAMLSWDYGGQYVSMNPWVKTVIDALPITYPIPKEKIPETYTQWGTYQMSTRDYHARSTDWYDWTNVPNLTYTPKYIYPQNVVASGFLELSCLYMHDRAINISVDVYKVSDYKISIIWSAPIRISYAAASRTRNILTIATDYDSSAFVDKIEEIQVSVAYAQPSEEIHTREYGLTLRGNDYALTDVTSKKYPINYAAGELYTLNVKSKKEEVPWYEFVAKNLLVKWRTGKYVVNCEVPGSWAIKNDVRINSKMRVILPNGQLLSNNTFSVKNIEKRFSAESFRYRLSLLEN